MKTKHPEISWDDLIFENRNKEYGAYELRQKYKQVLSLSLFFSLLLSFALAFFFHVQAVNRQMTEYREMFQFISTPIDLSELKNYQQSENLNQKSKSAKTKTHQIKITDSLTADTAAENRNQKLKPIDNKLSDSLKKDSTISPQKFENQKATVDSLFTVKDLPQFPGGQSAFNAYISNSLSLSNDIKNNKIHGLVQICFSIDKFGNPINIYIKKTINTDLNITLLEIIKNMPRWIPSQKYNENIRLTFTIPIIL
jgi:protein TonB